MSTQSTVIDVLGGANSIAVNEGGFLNNLNVAAQISSSALGDSAGLTGNKSLAAGAIMASGVAFGTGTAVLISDIANNKDTATIGADVLTLVGDLATGVGGVAQIMGYTSIGRAAEITGSTATIVGTMAQDYDAVQGYAANSPALKSLLNQVDSSMNQVQNIESWFTSELNGASSSVVNAWNATESSLNTALNDATNMVNAANTGSFTADATLTSNALDNLSNPFANLVYSTGATIPSITENGANNAVTDTSSNSTTPSVSTTVSGSSASVGVDTTSNGVNLTETDSTNSSTGTITDTVQSINANGTTQYTDTTTTTSNDQITANISGTGVVTTLDGAAVTLSNGTQVTVGGNNNTINAANTDTVTVDGNGNTLEAGDSLSATITGSDTSFVDGSDKITVLSNNLQTLSTSSTGVVDFGMVSAASGDSEGILWNPANGQATLDLTPTGGSVIATSLGQINPGDVLSVNNTTATLYNTSNQAMDAVQVNSDGSQIDSTYDTSGGTWSSNVYDYNSADKETEVQYNNTNGTGVYDFFNTAASGDPQAAQQFVNSNGTGEVAADGLGVYYANGDAPSVSVASSGNISVSVPASGVTDSFVLSSAGLTTTVDGQTLSDGISGTGATVSTAGSVTLSGGGITLTEAANGSTDTFVDGQDSISLAGNSVTSVAVNSGVYDFSLKSVASGDTEMVAWNPNNGQATLDLTNGSGTVATSLGQINPGDVLNVSGSTLALDNPSNQVMDSTTVNTDGSQVDTSYDTTGGTWSTDVYDYNTAGKETEVQYNNTNGNDVYDFYNTAASGDPQAAQQFVNSNGTGEVVADGFGVNYANGDAPNVSVASSGNINVSVPASSTTDTFGLSSTGITTTVSGQTLTDDIANTGVTVATNGAVTLSAGGSTITEAANGSTDTFTVGSDAITLADSAVNTVSVSNGTYDFKLNSVASGYNEDLTWNPSVGKAVLDVTNTSNNQVFATSLGYINPGDDLSVTSGSVLTNYNPSGQAMYATDVNSDGSQSDISYNLSGGNALDSVYTYSATGSTLEEQFNNVDHSAVEDFFNPSQNDSQVTQEILNSNGSGSVSWDGSGTTTSASFSSGLTVTASAAQDSLGISGNGTVTAASGTDVTENIGNGSNITFNESGGTINGGSSDTIAVNGNDTVNASSDTVSLGNSESDTINGTGNTVNLGTGDTVSASNDTVKVGASSTDTINGSSDSISANSGATGDALTVNGNSDTVGLNGSSSTTVTGSSDTVNASSDTVALGNSTSATVNGSGDTVNLGTGDAVSASNDTVRVGASSTDTVNGSSDNISANSGATGDALTVNGSSDTIGLNGGSSTTVTGSSDTVNASSDTVNFGNNSTAAINGSSDTVNLGASDAVSASNDHINIGSGVQDTVNGSSDSISAGSSDTIDVSGQSDSVSASSSSVDFSGSTSGDSVGGSGDSSDLGGGTGGGGGGGGGTGGGSGGGSGSGSGGFSGNKVKVSATLGASTGTIAKFGFAAQLGAKHLQTAFNEVNQAVSTNVQSAVLNGDKWAAGTVTWSFTAPSGASAAADSAYEATAQQAFAAWGLATGLQFQEVSKSSSTDIQIGWSNLDPTDTGLIAFTDYKASKGQFLAGDSITLENPTEDALTAGSNGQLTYAGTQATLLQVIEHEVGHTLGFADNNNASSIMNYYLGGSNQTLSSQDVGAAETLYGHNVGSSSSQVMINGQWQQLAQAMATSNGQTGMALYEGGQFVPLQQQPTPLAAGHA